MVKEILKKIGINLAVFYGLFSFAMMIFLSVIYALPVGSTFINTLGVFCALPFMFYPFYWVGISLVIGLIIGFLIGKNFKKKGVNEID